MIKVKILKFSIMYQVRNNVLVLCMIILLSLNNYVEGDLTKITRDSAICKIIRTNFYDANPFDTYPLVFEPISKGKLKVWSAISTLPSSDFRCITRKTEDEREQIELSFGTFVTKVEWTFFDTQKTTVYQGMSVNYHEKEAYRIDIALNQEKSYLQCNTINKISKVVSSNNQPKTSLRTSCSECDSSTLQIIDRQIEQIIKYRLQNQIEDNLHWHLSQLVTNHHSTF